MAKKVEEIIYNNEAVPATIAIIDGVIKVGLDATDIEKLATEKALLKISKKDLAYALSFKKSGATTVSATMLIAKMANIKVFATGGIGGVHRGASLTFDISRDLEELATTEVCVVSAGAKSILDLALTKEYLETKGVELIGYNTDYLPAFYTSKSQYKVDYNLKTPYDIAKLIKTKWDLGLSGGVVVANPIPEEFSLDEKKIDLAISKALEEAQVKKITGKEITPFLLNEIKDLTKGESLKANLELVYNNAILASKIANCLTKI